ncbi:MAG: enoyl-CoA hydratase-related protein [Paraburkholderia sp.]|uniref:enoyl-CoA hydratase-related protein n=1 Tax=Paraburkholderia sp. TaxID=1926495 RepID=UPI003C6A22CB
MNEAILKHRDGAVQVLYLNNPAARNAHTCESCATLLAALAEAQADPSVGAIVLTGLGNAFCIDGDLDRHAQRPGTPLLERRAGIDCLHDLNCSIRGCSKPVIAAVEGSVFGAGLSLALACDMLVAARNASFSLADENVGLAPADRISALVTEFISRQVMTEPGPADASVTAERLHGLGVVNRLSEPGSVLGEAISMAMTFASGPPQVIARIKTLCRHAGENTLEARTELEARPVMESVTRH